MTVFICKACGRAIKAEEKPNFCYFDRMSSIENIGDEDAIKMGLFSLSSGNPCILDSKLFTIEFIKDVRYTPIKGEVLMCKDAPFSNIRHGYSLDEFQDIIMKRVHN